MASACQPTQEGYNEWFPHRYKPYSEVYTDAILGGTSGERFANGGGAIHSTIVYVDAPHQLILSGPRGMMDGCSVYAAHRLETDGDSTLYRRRLDIWGVVSEEMEQGLRQGSQHLIQKCLVEYLEMGIKFTVAVPA